MDDLPPENNSATIETEDGSRSQEQQEGPHTIQRLNGVASLPPDVVAEEFRGDQRDGHRTISNVSKSDPFLPDFKDQARHAGPEAGGDHTSQPSIPFAHSVHAVLLEEELPRDPETLPAAVLETISSRVNAKNTVGSPNPPSSLSAVHNSNNDNIDPSSLRDQAPPPLETGEANRTKTALCKHMIWAGSFVVVAVIALLAAILMRGSGGSGGGDATDMPTNAPTMLRPSSTLVPTRSTESAAPADSGAMVNIDTEIKLTASDGAEGDWFGYNVAIDGDTVIIGSVFDDTDNGVDSGSVYVYKRSETGWTEQAKLTASNVTEGNSFGDSVAFDGNTILVGASDNSGGSAYVYTLLEDVWTEQAKLLASDAAVDDYFGQGVAIDGDTIVIGAPGDMSVSEPRNGNAYVYNRSGAAWTEEAKLTSSDGVTGDQFGGSVAINGDTIVVGAHYDDDRGENSGSAYVYTRSGSIWTEQAKLRASDGAADDWFGQSVAIDGDTIVAGARKHDADSLVDSGSAYVYTRFGILWAEEAKLTASDGDAEDWFGVSTAINGDTIVIGAWNDDVNGENESGGAYIYTRSGGVWSEQIKLTASDGAANDQFGVSVAIAGDTFVVGAWHDDTESGNDSGSVYIFQ